MASISETIQIVEAVVTQYSAFEAGQAITVPVASASYELALPVLGKVKVSESGTTLSISKG